MFFNPINLSNRLELHLPGIHRLDNVKILYGFVPRTHETSQFGVVPDPPYIIYPPLLVSPIRISSSPFFNKNFLCRLSSLILDVQKNAPTLECHILI